MSFSEGVADGPDWASVGPVHLAGTWIRGRWKGPDEQPKGWRPDINDGVKINIAPWERLGMFPVKKIVGKVEMGELDKSPP